MLQRLCLGTAQFGSHYGVSNRSGQPSEAEVAAILTHAAQAGVGYLDTAAGYTDAENLIGRHLPRGHAMRIVTKLAPVTGAASGSQLARSLIDGIEASMERLRVDRLYGVLLHRPDELAGPQADAIVEAMHRARADGLTDRIGASVYDADQLALIEKKLRPQLVQLPFSILDQRLALSGWLAKLKAAGSTIHARSIFLQGLLLMEPLDLPEFFAPLRRTISELRARWAEQEVDPLAGCLAFALRQAEVDVVLIGVNSLAELRQIEAAVYTSDDIAIDWVPPLPIDQSYLNPSRWPAFAS
jgi:aryl-alcohol dehydrogenase-like predicted oxidoreductase